MRASSKNYCFRANELHLYDSDFYYGMRGRFNTIKREYLTLRSAAFKFEEETTTYVLYMYNETRIWFQF